MVSPATKSSGSDRLLRLESLGSTIDAFHSRGIALGRSSSCQPLSCRALTTSHRMAKLSSTGCPVWVVCRSCPSAAALSSCQRGGGRGGVRQWRKQSIYKKQNTSTQKQGYADCDVSIPSNVGFDPCPLALNSWADDRKRYTATIRRHRAVQQNTPRFYTSARDANWSTQPRTGFRHQLLAVHHTAAFQLDRHRFLT